MYIDFADYSTIPSELEENIIDAFTSMPQNVVSEIKARSVEGDLDVCCAIEKYLKQPKAQWLYERLNDIMSQYEIICYHATKVLNKSSILNEGLKVNEIESYKNYIYDVCSELEFEQENINEIMKSINGTYENKYKLSNPQLCFFTNLSMIDTETPGYEQFCENIGGEWIRDALKRGHRELYKPLQEHGEAVIVKFKMPFQNIIECKKDDALYQIIVHYAGKYFWNKEFSIAFDGVTGQNVPPQNIIKLLPYSRKIDY